MQAVRGFHATVKSEGEEFTIRVAPGEELPRSFDAFVIGSNGTFHVHRNSIRETYALAEALNFVASQLRSRNA
jgi:hypothetical protein